MVRDSRVEPSTLRLDIADGPYLRSEPSMLMPHFADGSILQDRTFHALGLNHGRFDDQSWTFHVNAPYRGRSISQTPPLHAKARSRKRSKLPKISENQVEYQQSDEAEDKGVGGMFLVAVSVGLGDHLVADYIEHCAAGEGQHHRQ